MRSAIRCIAFLPLMLLLLARPAHADPMDSFTVTGNGDTVVISLPASTIFPGSGSQFNFGSLPGTVNGVDTTVGLNFITGYSCAYCQTIFVTFDSQTTILDLPDLYSLSYPTMDSEDFTLLAGSYNTAEFPPDTVPYNITIAAEAAATPEAPTLLLVATAALCSMCFKRPRAHQNS